MGLEKQNFIMAYQTPLGDYKVDESFDIYCKGVCVSKGNKSIPAVRQKIAQLIDMKRGQEIKSLQARIGEINGMSNRIEDYRIQFDG